MKPPPHVPHPYFLQVTSSTISWAPQEFTGLGITQKGLSWRQNRNWFSIFRLQDSPSVVSGFPGNNYKLQSLSWVLTHCFFGLNSSFGIRQKLKQIQHGLCPLKILFIKTSCLIGLIPPLPFILPPKALYSTWTNKTQRQECEISSVNSVSSVAQSCPTLCDPMNHSTPGLPVHHQLPEFIQSHVHQVGDAIQPSHPLSPPSPPAPNPSQHQGLFQLVNSSHEVAKVLEFQL